MLELWVGGRAVKSHVVPRHAEPEEEERLANKQVGGGVRSRITGFTKQSRMRLLWHLNQLDGKAFEPALFVTLTYPAGEFEPAETKRHLDVMLKRIRRRFPDSAVIWKLEYTKRLTAHYHLLILGVPFWAKASVGRAWAEIVRSNHPAHERVSTQVELVASQKHASMYMGKYVAKEQGCPDNHFGRFWGISGNIEAFEAGRVLVPVRREEYVRMRRLMDLIRRSKARAQAEAAVKRGGTGAVRRFKRAHNLDTSQRWFHDGKAALSILERICEGLQVIDLGGGWIEPVVPFDSGQFWN